MANSLPTLLTRRKAAHLLIARLQQLSIQFQGWKDARAARKAYQRKQ